MNQTLYQKVHGLSLSNQFCTSANRDGVSFITSTYSLVTATSMKFSATARKSKHLSLSLRQVRSLANTKFDSTVDTETLEHSSSSHISFRASKLYLSAGSHI